MTGLFALGMLTGVALLAAATAVAVVAIERRHPPAGQFVDVEGGRLHVLQLGHPNAPAVVLLHGASSNLHDMRVALGEHLAARYRVIMFDRPGHGWSDRPGGDAAAAPARQAELIAQALERLGVMRSFLVSMSWSGALATSYALAFPDRVAGLVLLAPVTHPWPGGIAWDYRVGSMPIVGPLFARTFVVPLAFPMLDRFVRAAFAPQTIPENYLEQAATALALRPSEFLANARDVSDLKANVIQQAPRYGAIRAPAVIIAGDRDATVSTDIHARALAAMLPHAKLIVLPEVGHVIQHAAAGLVIGEIDRLVASATAELAR
jgi:pimeloyl-ACP methyl ester carboxylesterase